MLNFPFYYEPHKLSLLAAEKVKAYLAKHFDRDHNFGLDQAQTGLAIGKMFGVLVVQTPAGHLGYLSAFSGKLADSNDHAQFVPPVYDMLQEGDFFKTQGSEIIQLNKKLEILESSSDYLTLQSKIKELSEASSALLAESKIELKTKKTERAQIRIKARNELTPDAYAQLIEKLSQESIAQQLQHKKLVKTLEAEMLIAKEALSQYDREIQTLKKERKERSNALQNQLFDAYQFLNGKGERKSLLAIFSEFGLDRPPAGAGECAGPKLLHYAYQHELQPLALGEFWWGASPKSEVRKHGHFYPACRSKCEPILGFMLQGLKVEENPMLQNPAAGRTLPILYEDESILVVNKPSEFLSVPGKNIDDSVYSRIKAIRPEANGPLIVHRLDMSTSGIMVLAKNKYAHDYLQRQFIKRQVEKRYQALLQGEILSDSGRISLPLRVDLDNRPQQLVCFEHGKKAITEWQKIKVINHQTLVEFRPVTGRTHQLRVHAAHPDGLNRPIVGDDLYGTRGERLHLHSAFLKIKHPQQKEFITFTADADFIKHE